MQTPYVSAQISFPPDQWTRPYLSNGQKRFDRHYLDHDEDHAGCMYFTVFGESIVSVELDFLSETEETYPLSLEEVKEQVSRFMALKGEFYLQLLVTAAKQAEFPLEFDLAAGVWEGNTISISFDIPPESTGEIIHGLQFWAYRGLGDGRDHIFLPDTEDVTSLAYAIRHGKDLVKISC